MTSDGYEELAAAPLGDNILAQIAATARDAMEAQREIEEAEENLRRAKQRRRTLVEETLPELMRDAGQTSLTTIDGIKVTTRDMYRGTPSKANQREAYQWLRDNGQGAIIKSTLEATFGRGDDERAQQALDSLGKLGVTAGTKETVHWQTLASVVRERLAQGQPCPMDLLGVHTWTEAVISVE